MEYNTDKHGTYTRQDRFVRTWGGKFHTPGWAVSEVRRYEDGTVRVVDGEPHYVRAEPDMVAIWQVYRIAAAALGAPEE